MRRSILMSMLLFFMAGSVFAQDGEKEVVIIRKEAQRNFTTIRVGLWFPKDREKVLTFADAEPASAPATESLAQAFGADLHFRDNIGSPLFFDFSAGAWYASNEFKYLAVTPTEAIFGQRITNWVVIIPVTAGLSIAPLPDKNPLQPYVMAGIGAYFATGGAKPWYPTETTQTDKTKIVFGGFVGAGMDFLLTPAFGASLGLKYHFVKFKEPLSTSQQDFTGLQIQLGIVSTF